MFIFLSSCTLANPSMDRSARQYFLGLLRCLLGLRREVKTPPMERDTAPISFRAEGCERAGRLCETEVRCFNEAVRCIVRSRRRACTLRKLLNLERPKYSTCLYDINCFPSLRDCRIWIRDNSGKYIFTSCELQSQFY